MAIICWKRGLPRKIKLFKIKTQHTEMGESLTNLLTEQGGLRTAYVTQTGNKTAKPLFVGAFLFLAPAL
jgi:hypothetical protein